MRNARWRYSLKFGVGEKNRGLQRKFVSNPVDGLMVVRSSMKNPAGSRFLGHSPLNYRFPDRQEIAAKLAVVIFIPLG